jgi:hypothetical protein
VEAGLCDFMQPISRRQLAVNLGMLEDARNNHHPAEVSKEPFEKWVVPVLVPLLSGAEGRSELL